MRLYARMNVTYRLVSFGMSSVGTTTAGLLVDSVGARAVLWSAPVVLLVSTLPVLTRPVRTIRWLD